MAGYVRRDVVPVVWGPGAADVPAGDAWALFHHMRWGARRGQVRRALATAARCGWAITPVQLERAARVLRAVMPRADRPARAAAAGLAGLAAVARHRSCPTLAHLADALGLNPGPPLLRALGYPGDAVARERAVQRLADARWAARAADDDDGYDARPASLDVAELAPHWATLPPPERAALLAAVAAEAAGRRALQRRGRATRRRARPGASGAPRPRRSARRVPRRRPARGGKSCAARAISPRAPARRRTSGRSPRPGPAAPATARARGAADAPSCCSSPRIRSAPQSGFSSASRRISAAVAPGSGGRPGPGRDCHRQWARNPARCQRSSVSGRTMRSACRQAGTRPARSTRSARSAGAMAGRATLRRSTRSCWRRRAFSASSCPLIRARSLPVPAECASTGRTHNAAPRVLSIKVGLPEPLVNAGVLPGEGAARQAMAGVPVTARQLAKRCVLVAR